MIEMRTPTPLLDLMVIPTPSPEGGAAAPPPGHAVASARVLMAFAKEQHDSLRRLDDAMGGYVTLRQDNRPAALAMRRLYEAWSAQADELLNRVRQLGLREQLAEEYNTLDGVVGRTQAMLSITLESLDRADEQIRTGQTYSLEEVRRELRAAAGR